MQPGFCTTALVDRKSSSQLLCRQLSKYIVCLDKNQHAYGRATSHIQTLCQIKGALIREGINAMLPETFRNVVLHSYALISRTPVFLSRIASATTRNVYVSRLPHQCDVGIRISFNSTCLLDSRMLRGSSSICLSRGQ